MPQHEPPPVQTMKASEARQNWSQLLNEVFREKTRVIVEKSGIPVAAVISAADFERLMRFEAHRQERFRALEETWAAFADVPPEELEARLAQALAEVRSEQYGRSDDAQAPL